jgi:hypothetical protein
VLHPELNEPARRILRCLCAETAEEIETVRHNFTRVDFDLLVFDGPYGQFAQLIVEAFRLYQGPTNTEAVAAVAERLGDRDLVGLARDVAVKGLLWEGAFGQLLEAYIETRASLRLREILRETVQIQEDGTTAPDGEVCRGFNAAADYVVGQVAALQRGLRRRRNVISSDDAPDQLFEDEIRKQQYNAMIHGGMGFRTLDEVTHGAHPGELWIIGGYASQGKTTLALNWIRYLALDGGWNIYYFTLEMPAIEIWQILAASHSAHPKWTRQGRRPIAHDHIRSGQFANEDEAHFYREVYHDFRSEYAGRIEVEFPALGMTIEDIWSRAEALHRTSPLDLVVIDYLSLLRPPPSLRHPDVRAATTENLKIAKNMAVEFAGGEGITVVTPHQISRDGYDQAKANGGVYEMRAFADTAEVERSADHLLTVFRDETLERSNEAKICHLKSRLGARAKPFNIYANFTHRYVADLRLDDPQVQLTH